MAESRGWTQEQTSQYEQRVEAIRIEIGEICRTRPWENIEFLNTYDQTMKQYAERAGSQYTPNQAGSYPLDAFQIALHCIYTTTSFQDAVTRATERYGDAAALGAITGMLAGALYGIKGIPTEWLLPVLEVDQGSGGVIALRLGRV